MAGISESVLFQLSILAYLYFDNELFFKKKKKDLSNTQCCERIKM